MNKQRRNDLSKLQDRIYELKAKAEELRAEVEAISEALAQYQRPPKAITYFALPDHDRPVEQFEWSVAGQPVPQKWRWKVLNAKVSVAFEEFLDEPWVQKTDRAARPDPAPEWHGIPIDDPQDL